MDATPAMKYLEEDDCVLITIVEPSTVDFETIHGVLYVKIAYEKFKEMIEEKDGLIELGRQHVKNAREDRADVQAKLDALVKDSREGLADHQAKYDTLLKENILLKRKGNSLRNKLLKAREKEGGGGNAPALAAFLRA